MVGAYSQSGQNWLSMCRVCCWAIRYKRVLRRSTGCSTRSIHYCIRVLKMSLSFIALLILSYLSGALPWSVWLGKLFFRVDPRSQTDGNPGAANAFRVGGWPLGVSVLLLDFFKA